MGWPVIALAAAGLGLQLWGKYSAKRAAQRAASFNIAVDEANAQAARASAEWAIARHRYQTRKLLGSQRARYAISGFQLEGTPLLVMQETAAQAELDEIAMRYLGETRAASFLNRAAATRFGREARSQAAKTGMLETLLTGGLKMAGLAGWLK